MCAYCVYCCRKIVHNSLRIRSKRNGNKHKNRNPKIIQTYYYTIITTMCAMCIGTFIVLDRIIETRKRKNNKIELDIGILCVYSTSVQYKCTAFIRNLYLLELNSYA